MYDVLLFLHFTGIALAVGTGFAFMALGIATKDMALPDRGAFMLRAFVLARNGNIGLLLLLLSGLGLVMKRGGFVAVGEQGGLAFKIKMLLFVVLLGVIGYMDSFIKKAKRDKGGPVLAKIPKLGPVALTLALAIIVCAVQAFH